jgi:hypothetical protein
MASFLLYFELMNTETFGIDLLCCVEILDMIMHLRSTHPHKSLFIVVCHMSFLGSFLLFIGGHVLSPP